MENTCNTSGCKLFDLLGGTPSQCPNYVECIWTDKDGKQKLVQDCAPKRTLLMIQELYNQQIRLQSSQEEQRNQSAGILNLVENVITSIQNRSQNIIEIEQ